VLNAPSTSGRQPLLILGALVAMYVVLGVLYESLAHPITIISTLPSAGLGALLALQLIPLVIATGPGTELSRLLGITIIGGLFVSQILDAGDLSPDRPAASAPSAGCSRSARPIVGIRTD
jgi:multidrug efflux pump